MDSPGNGEACKESRLWTRNKDGIRDDGDKMNKTDNTDVLKDLKYLISVSWPMVITMIAYMNHGKVATIFCGHAQHFGNKEHAAVSLANTMITNICLSSVIGMASACDTLFSQSFHCQRLQMGMILLRSTVILTTSILPVIAVLLNTETLLIMMHYEAGLARIAGEYVAVLSWSALPWTIFITSSKFLQNQNIFYPSMIIAIMGIGCNGILHYVVISTWKYPLVYSASCQLASYTLMAAINVMYIVINISYGYEASYSWSGWHSDILLQWGQFIKLSTSGFIMYECVTVVHAIFALCAEYISKDELRSLTISSQWQRLINLVSTGVSYGCAICVGQSLGRGDARQAKRMVLLSQISAACLVLSLSLLTIVLKNQITYIFTNSPPPKAEVAVLLAGVFSPIEGIDVVFFGMFRGVGNLHFGALVATVFCAVQLIIGIPVGLLTSLGVQGFWMGLIIGYTLELSTCLIQAVNIDWDAEVKNTHERISGLNNNENNEKSTVTYGTIKDIPRINKISCSSMCTAILFSVMCYTVFIIGINLKLCL